MKHPKGFSFLICRWRKDKEIAFRANQLYPEVFLPTFIVITLETEWLGETKFYKLYIVIFLYHLYFDNNLYIYTDAHIGEMRNL